ncbi:hypothetical protein C7B82_04380 [Stenomitos frigidus ULC18]|uniref:Uncharacterized protein n=1 Tax=Stenomitos frigidus ULC18 TaxID=2107698 RepID=A0A2T1ELX4_9CYAN|nr:hypothetical protein C7B82_04380 [Stenomitos frigidus ULC18]
MKQSVVLLGSPVAGSKREPATGLHDSPAAAVLATHGRAVSEGRIIGPSVGLISIARFLAGY